VIRPTGNARSLAAGIALLILVGVAFGAVTGFSFVTFDDDLYVTSNPAVRGGLTRAGVRWAFTAVGYASNWHPLTWLSHQLDVTLFGLDPAGHHLTGAILHAANAVLLFVLLKGMTGSVWRSFFAAALFAVHPLRVESVAWVSERKDVLSTFFWWLALLAWLAHLRRPGRRRLAGVAVLLALSLMAKPMAVTFPFLLLLLDGWPLGRLRRPGASSVRTARALLVEKWPFFALSAASAAVTLVAQERGRAIWLREPWHAAVRLGNALTAYTGYLEKTFLPVDLTVFYPMQREVLTGGSVARAAFLLASVTALAFLVGRRAPYAAVGWWWYLVALVPVIGFVKVGGQAMADRYTYVPTVGISVALVWGVGAWVEGRAVRRTVSAALAVSVLLALTLLTRRQAGWWKDGETLARRALEVRPDSKVAALNLAAALSDRGRRGEAEEILRGMIRKDPGNAWAWYNLGVEASARGDRGEAERCYREAVRLDPGNADARNNLGVLLSETGRMEEALEHYRAALRAWPSFAEAHANLGTDLAALGRRREARDHFREAVRLNPFDENSRAGLKELADSP
jgi:tetratricopeptide (TPR) repeat protein